MGKVHLKVIQFCLFLSISMAAVGIFGLLGCCDEKCAHHRNKEDRQEVQQEVQPTVPGLFEEVAEAPFADNSDTVVTTYRHKKTGIHYMYFYLGEGRVFTRLWGDEILEEQPKDKSW